jgi:hypothetical protein
MSKTMTKYQLEHFKNKVDRQFEPMIRDQELLVKQFKTEATDKAVEKLSKKIGADTIIKKFAEAENYDNLKSLNKKQKMLLWKVERLMHLRLHLIKYLKRLA